MSFRFSFDEEFEGCLDTWQLFFLQPLYFFWQEGYTACCRLEVSVDFHLRPVALLPPLSL